LEEDMAKRVRIVFLGLAMLAVGLALAPAAPAQERAPSTETIQLWLARICVHEMTWHVEHDCEPMFQVFNAVRDAMGRRRHTLIDAIARYSSRFYGGTGNRPWARLLRPGLLADPEGWPETWPDFRVFSDSWEVAYERAGAIVRGEVPTLCQERPRHWGSRNPRLPDHDRAERAIAAGRWHEVDCGPTVQAYYALGPVIEGEEQACHPHLAMEGATDWCR
jgi:hypothetical protein